MTNYQKKSLLKILALLVQCGYCKSPISMNHVINTAKSQKEANRLLLYFVTMQNSIMWKESNMIFTHDESKNCALNFIKELRKAI
jgi:hypothetical protein